MALHSRLHLEHLSFTVQEVVNDGTIWQPASGDEAQIWVSFIPGKYFGPMSEGSDVSAVPRPAIANNKLSHVVLVGSTIGLRLFALYVVQYGGESTPPYMKGCAEPVRKRAVVIGIMANNAKETIACHT
ncbi:uncharacterized protein SPSK_10922 [Sporothrix schenckii 1099-18]|uniref:Uncharacterized protein n=1 Tax=Sporothrix schenckii 1099-18 TaxID=1397361 RepID=A0A0F2M9Q1_SPOSC|nr:uncharacterized protein SPSK_10922 [Sporothrix schenckii 1099-18]KJR84891.1 hypothetical protein SPSK_10922 [Sporothrix schenckii 1099-18]